MSLKNCNHNNLPRTQICPKCEAPDGWQHFALCTMENLDFMFPDETNPMLVSKCKALCQNCPVKGFCLEIGFNDDFGIWAGFTTAERKRLRKVFSLKDKSKIDRRVMIRTIAHRL